MNVYPAIFPTPMIDGYALGVDMGVLRGDIQTGRPEQRRRYGAHTKFTFDFAIALNELDTWQSWANSDGYDWFIMNATSAVQVNGHSRCVTHKVRFTSNLNIQPITGTTVRVTVQAEQLSG